MSGSKILACLAVVFALSSCAAGANDLAGGPQAAGFWMGVWHGIILPVTFVVSLFNEDVSVYEVHNSGAWYNFGFVFGVFLVAGSGSGATARR